MRARSSGARRLLRPLGAAAAVAVAGTATAAGQSDHDANPERPTFATHAYAVAPGYLELEQGLSARGLSSLREETSWDVNLKVGIAHHVQVALFGPAYARTSEGAGVSDLGVALKLGTDLSPRTAAAIVTSVTAPTGSAARGLGAGRALGGLVAVASIDFPGALHVDANAGPQAIGAGTVQWFTSLSASRSFGRVGITGEIFQFTAGGGGPRLAGFLGAATMRLAGWMVMDAGGVARMTDNTPHQVFLGLTTNLGRVW